MRTPFRHIHGHLLWSTTSQVWALWRVTPLPGGYLPTRVHQELLGRVTSLVRSMPGMEPRLFVLAARTDPGEVAERMVADVDWQRLPAWAQTCAAAVDLLTGQEMHERTLWLAVPLAAKKSAAGISLGALYAELSAALDLPPVAVSEAEVRAAVEEAGRVQTSLGGGLGLRPASPAEIVWMLQHAVHRGLTEEPLLGDAEHSPLFGSRVRDGKLSSPSYADLGQIRLAEGGRSHAESTKGDRTPWWRSGTSSPMGRKWLQVESDAGTGYQAHLVLAELPPAVAVQSADVLAQLEGLPFPVDVAVDLRVVPARKAREQVQRKKRELLDQAEQYGAQPTGMPHS
ncbi:ATP/GTP-binding protein, partial [Streptomyces sp. NPDC058812]